MITILRGGQSHPPRELVQCSHHQVDRDESGFSELRESYDAAAIRSKLVLGEFGCVADCLDEGFGRPRVAIE